MALRKGSAEAKAWGERMWALRKQRRGRQANPLCGQRNPKGDYTGILKLPFYIERAVAMVLHDGPKALDREWCQRMTPENKTHFAKLLTKIHHSLVYQEMTPEQRFKRFILDTVMPRIERNPGEAYHVREADYAHQVVRGTDDADEKLFYAGVESAHRISASSAKKLKMNPRSRMAKNPIAVYGLGNPPKGMKGWTYDPPGVYYKDTGSGRYTITAVAPRRWQAEYTPNTGPSIILGESSTAAGAIAFARAHRISPTSWGLLNNRKRTSAFPRKNPPQRGVHAGIAGIIYHRCLEVRAEKTGSFKPGLYRHPFSRKSAVQVLALDSGDILLHSTSGMKLWERP